MPCTSLPYFLNPHSLFSSKSFHHRRHHEQIVFILYKTFLSSGSPILPLDRRYSNNAIQDDILSVLYPVTFQMQLVTALLCSSLGTGTNTGYNGCPVATSFQSLYLDPLLSHRNSVDSIFHSYRIRILLHRVSPTAQRGGVHTSSFSILLPETLKARLQTQISIISVITVVFDSI